MLGKSNTAAANTTCLPACLAPNDKLCADEIAGPSFQLPSSFPRFLELGVLPAPVCRKIQSIVPVSIEVAPGESMVLVVLGVLVNVEVVVVMFVFVFVFVFVLLLLLVIVLVVVVVARTRGVFVVRDAAVVHTLNENAVVVVGFGGVATHVRVVLCSLFVG
eukprot:jgi/Psemu1/301992/fgenesh1_kg.54_\